MGKEKRGNKKRPKPAGVMSQSSEVAAEVECESSQTPSTGSLQEMAGSTTAVTRATACTTYGMLFEGMKNRGAGAVTKKKNKADKSALGQLMDQGTPALLCRMLCMDPDANVKAQAANALKSMIGALAVLDVVMIDQLSLAGLASSLVTAIQQSIEGVQVAVQAVGHGEINGSQKLIVQSNILERSLTASIVLFQSSELSVSAFTEAALESNLLGLLEASVELTSLEGLDQVMRRCAHFIHKCLDNNLALAVKMSQLVNGSVSERDRLIKVIERLSILEFPVESADKLHMTAVHLAGGVVNIHLALVKDGRENQEATAQTVASVVPSLLKQLTIDGLGVMPPPELDRPDAPAEEGFTPTLSVAEEEAQVTWTNFCARSVVVLEILHDFISGFDEDDEEDEGWDSDDEAGMDLAAAAQSSKKEESLKKACLNQCLGCMEQVDATTTVTTFLENLLAITTTHNIRLPDHLGVIAEVCDVRTHICLLLSRLLSVERGSCSSLWHRLVAICRTGFQEMVKVGPETSGQWMPALANVLAACLESDPTFLTVQSSELEGEVEAMMGFLGMLVAQDNSEVQLHGLRCVGVLANRWCSNETLCRQFGTVSVGALSQGLEHASPMMASQALDVLMDVFSEDDDWLHALYLNTNTHAKMKEGHASLKAKVRSGGDGLDRDAVSHIKEVLLNTSRFLKYKANFPGLN